MGPMIIMNCRMKEICHRLGQCSRAVSTLWLGMLTCDAQVIEEVVQQDLRGQHGQEGKNSDAAAMLNMFPKLELVPVTVRCTS